MAGNGLKLTLFFLFIIAYEYWSTHVNFVDLVKSGSTHVVQDVFILAGQSNMAGRGGVIDGNWDGIIPTEMKSSPGKILRLGGDLRWKDAEEPLHVDIDVNKTCGVGPGMAFANAVVRGGSERFGVVGLVPCAIGGSGIDEWARDGRLYRRLVKRASVAIKGGGEIRALLWFQGERDTVNISDAESYKGKLRQLFIDLRTDLKSPMLPVIQMADVASYHGGDGAGDDGPPGGGNWQPDTGCQSSGGSKRGRTRNKGLKATIQKSSSNTLEIDFEAGKNSTYVAVGPNGDSFNTLVGTIVGKIPQHYESWRQIPPEYTTTIIPEIQTYFDLSPHLNGPYANEIRAGIIHYCKGRYRDQKNKFKKDWFDSRGGLREVDTLQNMPPPNMSADDWNKYLSMVTSPKFQARSEANKRVRSKQTITVHQGRKTLAQNRYANRDPITREPPSVIDEYRRLRSRNGEFTTPAAAANYKSMIALKKQQAGLPTPMSDDDILKTVVGSSRAWQPGVGQKLSRSETSSSTSQSSQRLYTQDEVERMMTQMREEMMRHTAPLFQAMTSQGFLPDSTTEGDDEDEDGEGDGSGSGSD